MAPLARGWLRQLDTGRNPVFYRGDLNRLTYASWLAENAVRYVALPSAKPDRSSYAERALIEDGLPYLRLVWRSADWRVYRVLIAAPMVVPRGPARIRLERLGSDELLLEVERPGAALVRVRWTPYWFAAGGCVERAGAWTRVIARAARLPAPVHALRPRAHRPARPALRRRLTRLRSARARRRACAAALPVLRRGARPRGRHGALPARALLRRRAPGLPEPACRATPGSAAPTARRWSRPASASWRPATSIRWPTRSPRAASARSATGRTAACSTSAPGAASYLARVLERRAGPDRSWRSTCPSTRCGARRARTPGSAPWPPTPGGRCRCATACAPWC